VDYGFHLIIANPDAATLDTDLPAAIRGGIRSFKIFMTYDRMRLHDEQILDVMAAARRDGALVMVHAENHGMISWLAGRMLKQGNALPRYHAICHTRGSEAEAIQRIVAFAELMDCPILIVHVSTAEGIEAIRRARARGLRVLGETCPQYLFLTAKDIDRGLEGAQTTFKEMANGVPGLELRLPLLFSEGYRKGRLTLREFVDLGSTRHAQTYGIYPQKGAIAIGSDADLAIWDPDKRVRVSASMLHDNTGYTPYAGRELTGWPVTVLSRGEIIVREGKLDAARGRGRFLARAPSDALRPAGRQVPEMAQLAEWNTPLQL